MRREEEGRNRGEEGKSREKEGRMDSYLFSFEMNQFHYHFLR